MPRRQYYCTQTGHVPGSDMRLLILTQYYPPETGAPQTRLSEMAAGLQARGWEISVVCGMPNYPHGRIFEPYRGKWSIQETIGGIPVRRFWLYASNASRALPRILSMLSFSATALQILPRIWRRKPDFLFVESPPLTLAFSAWLLCRLSGTKLIFNVSDLWPLTARELGAMSDGWFYRFLESIERFLYRRAWLCTGQSQEIVDYIQERGARQVLLFRNGVDLTRFGSGTTLPQNASDKPRLVYTGLLGVAQGILQICKAVDFAQLNLEFHLYGAGTEKEALEAFLAAHPDRGIVYHGSVKGSEIPGIVAAYDGALIALVRHIYGAVPSKIYEAMAAGLPIVFSGDGEGARIIAENGCGWTNNAGDYAQLRQNLALFQQQATLRREMALNSRDAAEKRFNRAIQVENLHQYLQKSLV